MFKIHRFLLKITWPQILHSRLDSSFEFERPTFLVVSSTMSMSTSNSSDGLEWTYVGVQNRVYTS